MPDFAAMLYGGAQKSAENFGQGAMQSFQQGNQDANAAAGLAIQQEHLNMQTEQMKMQMQQLQTAKTEKLYDFMKGASNIQNAGDRSNYLKNVIGYRNAMGLPADPAFDDSIKRLGTDENQQRLATIQLDVESGKMTAQDAIDLATNPLKADKFAQIAMTPLEFMNKRPDLSGAQKDFLERQSKEKQAGERANVFNERNVVSQHAEALKEVTAPSSIVQKKLGAYQSIDNSYKAFVASGGMGAEFEQFQNQLRLNQGATGGKTGVAERAKAHATDLGITAQQYIQLATGHVQDIGLDSNEIVKAMKEVGQVELGQIKKQAFSTIDAQTAGRNEFYKQHPDKAKDYYARVNAIKSQFDDGSSGLDGPPGGQISFNGKMWDRKVLQTLVEQHPDDPKSAAAKTALGL